MEKKTKKIFGLGIVLGGAILLSSCNSFCSDTDVSNYLYTTDPINTTFFDSVAHGEDYIKETFRKQNNFDQEVNFNTDEISVKKISDDGKSIETVKYDADLVFEKINDNLFKIKPVDLVARQKSKPDANNNRSDITYTFGLNNFTKEIISKAKTQFRAMVPSYQYFDELDDKYFDEMLKKASSYSWLSGLTKETITYEQVYGYSYAQLTEFRKDETNEKLLNEMLEGEKDSEGNHSKTLPGRNYSLLTTTGHIKFEKTKDDGDHFEVISKWTDEIVKAGDLTSNDIPSKNFLTLYKNELNGKAATFKTCITMQDGFYGHIGNDPLNNTILIEGKGVDFYEGWGKAFSEHGLLEGLLVYPISALVENLSHSFGMNGYGQIGAVLLTTLIVRSIFILLTLPSTMSQQKMTFLQPELAKIQQKYPNAATNQYEKQKLAQAQMALYKKYKVHPFRSMLVIFIQFPLFISVWNAFSGSASLSRDSVLGLRLSETVWQALTNVTGWPAHPGWWTALVLIILMSIGQIFAMMIPQWLNKKRTKNVSKTGKNPTVDQQAKTMKITQWVMTGMVIFMGFTLPSALGVYWLAGSIFSILQSVVMHFVFMRKTKKGQI